MQWGREGLGGGYSEWLSLKLSELRVLFFEMGII